MNASRAASSAAVGSRKSGFTPLELRASVRGKCCWTAPAANVCRSGMSPLNPNGAVRLRLRRCGDFRKTAAVGGKPSMFSRMRPRPCVKSGLPLLLIRDGSSRPETLEPGTAARLPAVTVDTVAEHTPSVTVPDKSGDRPP